MSEQGGTLIRGADGVLYFIPDEKLEPFALPKDIAEKSEKVLRAGEIVGTLSGPVVKDLGLRASDRPTVVCISLTGLEPSKAKVA